MTKVVTMHEFLRFAEGARFDKDTWTLAALGGAGDRTMRVVKLTALDLLDALKNTSAVQREQVLSGIRAQYPGPGGGAWFYEMGAAAFADKLRERCKAQHLKVVDSKDLERVMSLLIAARPFFMFPGTFSPSDISDVESAAHGIATTNEESFAQRITELFHPDMNYPDIEVAVKGLLALCGVASVQLLRQSHLRYWGDTLRATNEVRKALWSDRKTQLEMDEARADHELTEAEHAAGVSTDRIRRSALPDPPPSDYRATAVALWTLLDEIDTLGDSLKPSDLEGYRNLYTKMTALAAGRHALLTTDGHTLRLPDDPPSPAPEQVKFKDILAKSVGVDERELAIIREVLLGHFAASEHVRPTWQLLNLLIARQGTPAPVPMLLHCPMCHTKHIDEGEFATRQHHTHACQGRTTDGRHCGHVWRPAIVPTVGVEALPGFVNDPTVPSADLVGSPVRVMRRGKWVTATITERCLGTDGEPRYRLVADGRPWLRWTHLQRGDFEALP